MDLAGKAYSVPAYALVGGKFRDRIRMYCDTPNEPTGAAMGTELLKKIDQGLTMLKMDVGVQPLIGVEGALSWPQGMLPGDSEDKVEELLNITQVMHPFTHVRLTPKGIDLICEYVAEVRAVVGDKVPIAADHFGHIGIDDCLRLGQALEPYNLAWLEDLVPWQFTDKWVQLERALNTPVCTGEDIYLLDGFKPLLEARAVNIIHPDLATSGGIMETKKIGDYAQEYGISMALHMAGTPISTMASVHCAAATQNFIALEHHFNKVSYLGRLHRRRAEADHPERLHPGARRAGPRLRAEPRRRPGEPRPLGHGLLRADPRVGRQHERAQPRPAVVMSRDDFEHRRARERSAGWGAAVGGVGKALAPESSLTAVTRVSQDALHAPKPSRLPGTSSSIANGTVRAQVATTLKRVGTDLPQTAGAPESEQR